MEDLEGEVEAGRFGLVAFGGCHCGYAGTQSAEPDCDDKCDHIGFSCWSIVVFVLHCCSAWVYYYYSTPHVSNTFLPFVHFSADLRFGAKKGMERP